MGGFHLTGSHFEPFIEPTTQALKSFKPDYLIPTHCTGRKAVNRMEEEFPGQFILNMAGTKLILNGDSQFTSS
jgi:7,8-dihydropterin-6-yl-methyl-4-(beta-D-ribofuranosyl)aminobenzene 5'-phosphate synthase